MTCQVFERIESDYLAGSLTEGDARAFESHAAGCSACEERLEAMSRRDVSTFAPVLPAALRAHTLAAVRTRRHATQRMRRWWAGGVAAAAAVLALMVGVSRPSSTPYDSGPAPIAMQDTAVPPAVTLAMLSSREEFAAIDEAIRELEAALTTSPGDPALRAFLASAVARRVELQRQVKDAA